MNYYHFDDSLSKNKKALRLAMLAVSAAISIAVWMIIASFVYFDKFSIPSKSMNPTLTEGDYVFVDRFSYGLHRDSLLRVLLFWRDEFPRHQPARGDVAVFQLPTDNRTIYIMRVVGLSGDRVQVRGGRLFITQKSVTWATPDTQKARRIMEKSNKACIPNCRLLSNDVETAQIELDEFQGDTFGRGRLIKRYRETISIAGDGRSSSASFEVLDHQPEGQDFYDNTDVFVVPEGHFFVLGDNRDNSLDSRAHVGFVPIDNLMGKAKFVYFSTNWTDPFRGGRNWPRSID